MRIANAIGKYGDNKVIGDETLQKRMKRVIDEISGGGGEQWNGEEWGGFWGGGI